ncbi:MAG: hypothetical protein IJI98_09700 [Methanosphaera sp.]|uniref:hypothetical protein n=1 Tax=Methanosphaera sp. ISO3-F5 TaxID=1452353 RepID=UPI002B258113|nr:hypothetical protein [Methanosphaera sp. ISO3-F5]MBR0472955.1 hypothetical protein [Methanosphaera sp.]WQH64332.1 hypothetical protein PXD04_00620 [Methanosphaera sp. ISO3-F5]
MKWSTLQSKAYGLNINDFISEKFLDKLRNEFKDKDVDVITLQITVRDKIRDPKNDDAKVEIISLSNSTIEDTLLHNTIVDVTSDENFEKIKKVIDNFKIN